MITKQELHKWLAEEWRKDQLEHERKELIQRKMFQDVIKNGVQKRPIFGLDMASTRSPSKCKNK